MFQTSGSAPRVSPCCSARAVSRPPSASYWSGRACSGHGRTALHGHPDHALPFHGPLFSHHRLAIRLDPVKTPSDHLALVARHCRRDHRGRGPSYSLCADRPCHRHGADRDRHCFLVQPALRPPPPFAHARIGELHPSTVRAAGPSQAAPCPLGSTERPLDPSACPPS